MPTVWPGQKVTVFEPDWDDEMDEYYLPDGWDEGMLQFVGQTVTISRVREDGVILIEEDGRTFEWIADDFILSNERPSSDPNIRYQIHKARQQVEAAKKKPKVFAARDIGYYKKVVKETLRKDTEKDDIEF